jgi:hypothetical protein
MEQPELEDNQDKAVIAKVQAVHCKGGQESFDELTSSRKMWQVRSKAFLKRF